MPKYSVRPLIDTFTVPMLETEIMKFWSAQNVFQRSVDRNRSVGNNYILFDGPPFATGLPHYGHILAGTLKDAIPRYKTMRGYVVERQFGWDCHGVPVEYNVERERSIAGNVGIERMGIAEFNEACRSIVLRFTQEWRKTQERVGRFVDMDNAYKTMDPSFMESVWAVFKEIYGKGLVYEGDRVSWYSPILATPLSDFETKLNYKMVSDPLVILTFPLVDDPTTSLLVSSIAPWAIPSNVAIAINPKFSYVKITLKSRESYILLENAVDKYFNKEDIQITDRIHVKDIIGSRYVRMFPTLSQDNINAFQVVEGEFITRDNGTGLVSIAPTFGEEDSNIGKKYKLPTIKNPYNQNCKLQSTGFPSVNPNQKFVDMNKSLGEVDFKAVDKPLIEYMKAEGRVLCQETLVHEYPFCWRTEAPLMSLAVPSWYVKVTDIKDAMLFNNDKVNWYPDEVGTKRFKNWIIQARDWSISRNRYWGCPLPVWRNVNNSEDIIVIGSIDELEQLSGKRPTDLHRHFIDDIVIKRDGNTYRRVSEIFDCWFESGAMPYAQYHYTGHNRDVFLRDHFPADFIAEGIDQTRGWFYTLMVLSSALFNKPAFKNCLVNGIVLGDDGQKMSKSKGNFPPVEDVFDKYGADAVRFFLLGSPAARAQTVYISAVGFENVLKRLLIPIYNIYLFFANAANNAGGAISSVDLEPAILRNPLDQWLFRRTEVFKEEISAHFENYDFTSVCGEIQKFVDSLSKWYVRNIKTVLVDRNYAYRAQTLQCLHFALETFSKCAAPIIPFMTDFIYRSLYGQDVSVHLQDWPEITVSVWLDEVYSKVEIIRKVVSLGQEAREKNGVALKQPLSIIYLSSDLRSALEPYSRMILTSLNVLDIEWVDGILAEMGFNEVVLNHDILGPKFRNKLLHIEKEFAVKNFSLDGDILTIANEILSKTAGDFSLQFRPVSGLCSAVSGAIWVALNSTMTPELSRQGSIRELQRHIQRIRKELQLSFSEQISLRLTGNLGELLSGEVGDFFQRTNTVLIVQPVDTQETASRDLIINNYKGSVCIYRVIGQEVPIETLNLVGGDNEDDDFDAPPTPVGLSSFFPK